MKFMVLLFSLLLQRQTKKADYQRDQSWFNRLTRPFDVINLSLKGQVLAYITAVVIPSLLLWLIIVMMNDFFWGLVGFVLQVILFLYILGRDDYSQKFSHYKSCWQREDYQAAFLCAKQLLNVQEQACAKSPCYLHQEVSRALIYTWFTRFFVLVFWLLIAGVPGAFGCMLSYWFAQTYQLAWTKTLVAALEWIPVRLMGISIALAGDFVTSFANVVNYLFDFHTDSRTVLMKIALIDDHPDETSFEIEEAENRLYDINKLMMRCAVIWLLVAAFFTIFGRL